MAPPIHRPCTLRLSDNVQYGAANKAADGYYARMKRLMKSAPSAEGESEDGVATDEAALTAYGFGHARVEYNGQEITDLEWRSEKSREMFFFFLCNRRGLRKEEIVAVLWPDMPEEKTTSAFHSNMYRLRKALYTDIISKESGRYQLDPGGDFVEFGPAEMLCVPSFKILPTPTPTMGAPGFAVLIALMSGTGVAVWWVARRRSGVHA